MAGRQTLRLRGGPLVAALAVSFLTSAAGVRAQNPSPPLPPAGTPAASVAEAVDAVTAPEATPAPTTAPGPMYYPAYRGAPAAARVGARALRHDHRVDLRQARSEHLASAAALDALQRGLERSLGAVAQRLGRRTAAGLDQRHGRQPLPAVVLHVRPGVQPGPEGRRLPRRLHDLHAIEPPPGPDHQRPLRAPQQRRHRPAHHRPEPQPGRRGRRRRRRRATPGSATSRSRPACCCTRRRTFPSRASSRS